MAARYTASKPNPRARYPRSDIAVAPHASAPHALRWFSPSRSASVGDGCGERAAFSASRVLLVHCGAVAGGLRVRLAHVRAMLRGPVVVRACEMVDARLRVDPHDRVRGAAVFRLLLGCELPGAGRSAS